MAIYTRTGDTGTTSLFGGKRVLKCEELVDVYGSIDELNSWVGHLASDIQVSEVQNFLSDVQSDLFTIGSVLAGWRGSLRHLEMRVKQMEARIDALEKELPPISNFLLPGGTPLAGHAHIARAICRRVERQMVSLKVREIQIVRKRGKAERIETLNISEPEVNLMIKYLNRLSDLLFMLARFINKQADTEETVWKGIQTKSKE